MIRRLLPHILCFLAIVALVIGVLEWRRSQPFDDSDSPPNRSGLTIRRDALTGCEYVSTSRGLHPRMDANGRQICRKETP